MKTIINKPIIYFLGLLFSCQFINAQNTEAEETSPFLEVNKDKLFKPIFAIETWATYSMNEGQKEDECTDRGDIMLRRFRFGGSGNPYSWLKYSFQLHFDRIGEDSFSSTKGSYSGVGLWNAYITAKLLKNSELLNLHAGYFWAAISRDYMTSPWAVGSFDKTRATFYLRNFVTGTGNGITSGIALGGIKNFKNFGISYRVGSYEPSAYENNDHADRLYTGRIMFSFGDPEQKSYKYMVSGQQWRKRNGVTVGFGGSTQINGYLNDTTCFSNSKAYGADILINYVGLSIDGEYFLMKRSAKGFDDFDGTQWHIRGGYSFIFKNKYIEPYVSYERYNGEGSSALYKYIGDDTSFDVGINWYLNKDKLKLALHYIIQDGDTNTNTGNILGLACQFRL